MYSHYEQATTKHGLLINNNNGEIKMSFLNTMYWLAGDHNVKAFLKLRTILITTF